MGVLQRLAPYITRWGYLAIFASAFLENMGIPIPAEVFVIIAASFALHGKVFLPLVIIIAAAGAVAGDSVVFFVGRFGGRKAIAKLRDWLSIDRHTIERIDSFYHRRGPYAVILGRFVTGGRFTIAITSGASSTMSWGRYAFYDYVGALIWASIFGLLGYYFADQIGNILTVATRSSLFFGLILLFITMIYVFVTYILRQARKKK